MCVLGSLPFPDLDNGVLEGTSAHVFPQLVSSITTADQNFSFIPGSLSYAHLNVQSLAPKLEEIQIFLQKVSGHVILGLSETWLGDLFSDLAVSVASYISYRRDRPHGRGGGYLFMFQRLFVVEEGMTLNPSPSKPFGLRYGLGVLKHYCATSITLLVPMLSFWRNWGICSRLQLARRRRLLSWVTLTVM